MMLLGSPLRLLTSAIFIHPVRVRSGADSLVIKLKTCQNLRLLSVSYQSNCQDLQKDSVQGALRCQRQWHPHESKLAYSLTSSPIHKSVSLTSTNTGHRKFSIHVFNGSPSKSEGFPPRNTKTSINEQKTANRQTQRLSWSEIKTELFKVPGTGGMSLKDVFKKYGIPFAIWYSSLYFGGFAAAYLAIESGVLGLTGGDVIDWVSNTYIGKYFDVSRIDPKYGNIGAAIVANEILELARLPLAILTIPYIKAAWEKRRIRSASKRTK